MTGRILVAIALLVAAVVAVASAVPTEPHMAGEFGVELDDWPLLPNLHGLKSEEEERVFYARVGPFTIQPKKTFDGQPMMIRPLPDELIEISHWGDWEHEYEDGSIVPNSKIYHHHNFCYMSGGSSGFMTGLSNERNTWGPNNLHTVDQRDEETGEVIAYRVPLNPGATVKCNFHTNSLASEAITFYLSYKIHYRVHKAGRPVRVVQGLHWMDKTWNVKVGSAGPQNKHHVDQKKKVTVNQDMILVTIQSHLHQGGLKHELYFVNPPQDGRDQEICTSIPIYGQSADCNEELCTSLLPNDVIPYKEVEDCSWDCASACKDYPNPSLDGVLADAEGKWKAYTWQTVCHPMVTLHAGETLEFNAIYDDSCGWHGVMSWWFYFAWPVGGQILD